MVVRLRRRGDEVEAEVAAGSLRGRRSPTAGAERVRDESRQAQRHPRRAGDRAKPPAWLRTAGSRNARTGAKAKPPADRPEISPRGAVSPANLQLGASPAKANGRSARRPQPRAPAAPRRRSSVDQLSENARVVLERRYLVRDGRGKVIETPDQLFRRVAHHLAVAEAQSVPANRPQAAVP